MIHKYPPIPTARAVSIKYSSEGYSINLTSSGIAELIELSLGAERFCIRVALKGYFFQRPVIGLRK